MSSYNTNIYKTARQKAGMTQEKAAEALGISVESLKAYESYNRLLPANVVDCMCIIYDAIYLAYQHTRIASSEVQVVPEIQVLDLPRAAIRLINRVIASSERSTGTSWPSPRMGSYPQRSDRSMTRSSGSWTR